MSGAMKPGEAVVAITREMVSVFREEAQSLAEHYARRLVHLERENEMLKGYLRDAIANLDPASLGDYALWREAATH